LNISQNYFHLPDRTSWVPFSVARRRISLAPGNRTTINVEPCYVNIRAWATDICICMCYVRTVCHNVSGARVAQWVRSLDLTTHTSLSPIQRGFAPGFVNNKKGCTRLAATSDKVFQLLAHGRWFSQGTPAFSTTKTSRHDIAEILLKMALTQKNQSICMCPVSTSFIYFVIFENHFYLCIEALSSYQTSGFPLF
jgi:hypothetical protein